MIEALVQSRSLHTSSISRLQREKAEMATSEVLHQRYQGLASENREQHKTASEPSAQPEWLTARFFQRLFDENLRKQFHIESLSKAINGEEKWSKISPLELNNLQEVSRGISTYLNSPSTRQEVFQSGQTRRKIGRPFSAAMIRRITPEVMMSALIDNALTQIDLEETPDAQGRRITRELPVITFHNMDIKASLQKALDQLMYREDMQGKKTRVTSYQEAEARVPLSPYIDLILTKELKPYTFSPSEFYPEYHFAIQVKADQIAQHQAFQEKLRVEKDAKVTKSTQGTATESRVVNN